MALLRTLPALAWYRLIWGFSAQTADVSGGLSDRLLWRLLALLSPAFAASDPSAQNDAVELLSFAERKAAHMFLYFVLALLLWLAVALPLRRNRHRIAAVTALCAALAALDEWHQLSVPGRSGQVRDVLIDLTGAAMALALSALLLWVARRRRRGIPCRPAWCAVLLCAALMAATLFAFPAQPETAPILREVCFLTLCGLLGWCAALSALLCGLSPAPTLGLAAFSALLPAALGALSLGAALLPSAAALTMLGCGLGFGLWLLARCLLRFREKDAQPRSA